MNQHHTHEYDVLVVGAGGAGLGSAIEASAGDASVGLVCKSLLGKAPTVMAEGGIAAALATVDDRDNWKVHFADMPGGACPDSSVLAWAVHVPWPSLSLRPASIAYSDVPRLSCRRATRLVGSLVPDTRKVDA